jgi:two-component system, sensor histidine kinase
MTDAGLAMRVLIVAPIGRDASAIAELLRSNRCQAQICGDPGEAASHLDRGAGILLLTEEALQLGHLPQLLQYLGQQPAWSELPVIVLTAAGESHSAELVSLRAAAGSITLLERPLGSATLLRSIEVALRSRRRQYQVRDLLESQQARESDLRESEERLRQAIVALQEADRRKDAFLATLSHELRNPLAPIRNAAEVLASPRLTPLQLRWTQSVIRRQTAHMALLLEDLLELTRITQGKLQLRKQACSLQSIFEAAVETARPLIERKGHQLSVSLPEDLPTFIADPLRLAQVISNLLTNSAKYTDAGGRIELWSRLEEELLIGVRDNGIGIPTEQVDQVFTMFSQIPSARARAEGGLGVGLALVRGLVELHGGVIEARSSGPGTGSQFVVRLPFEAASTLPATAAESESAVAPVGRLRILIADDNHDSADSLSMLLSMEGHEVQTAYSGLAAISAARTFRPDVALLDIGMPDVDGYAAAKRIREQRGGADIYLIALTGWGQDEDKRRASEAGFAMHLTKPVDPDQLRALLANQHKSAASLRSGDAIE